MAKSQGPKIDFQTAPADAHHISTALAQNWWAVAIRGVLGIVFGLVVLAMPGVTMLSVAYLFGAYAAIDGVFAIVSAFGAALLHRHWGLLVFEGIAGILAGALAWFWPNISLTAFVLLIGVWAIVSGAAMFRAAFGLHVDHGRWWLLLGGVVSMVFGAMLAVSSVGRPVPTVWISAYALIFGVSLLILGFKLRARKHDRLALA
jgi:uncharacterized membrane protein HdeD (DUF308 family)